MADVARPRPTRSCPICGKHSVKPFVPFCSARCQDVDLHRWLSDGYRIPTEEPETPPESSPDDED